MNAIDNLAEEATTAFTVIEILRNGLTEILAATEDPIIIDIIIRTVQEAGTALDNREVVVTAEKVLETGQ